MDFPSPEARLGKKKNRKKRKDEEKRITMKCERSGVGKGEDCHVSRLDHDSESEETIREHRRHKDEPSRTREDGTLGFFFFKSSILIYVMTHEYRLQSTKIFSL